MRTVTKKSESKTQNRSPFFKGKGTADFIGVQTKLSIGKPNDKYENEADRVADVVVQKSQDKNQSFFSGQNYSTVQKQTENPIAQSITPLVQKQEEEEEVVQTKLDLGNSIQKQEEDEEVIQTKSEEEEVQPKLMGSESVQRQEEEEEEAIQAEPLVEQQNTNLITEPTTENSTIESQISNSKGGGNPLPDKTKSEMENSFGADFSQVRTHSDSNAVQMNKDIGARAFTHGNDIYFNEGKLAPETAAGKHLIAHELTHTVQQGASKANTNNPETAGGTNMESQTENLESAPLTENTKAPESDNSSNQVEDSLLGNTLGEQTESEQIEEQESVQGEEAESQIQTESKSAVSPSEQSQSQGLPQESRGQENLTDVQRNDELIQGEEQSNATEPNLDSNAPVTNIPNATIPESLNKIATAPDSVIKPHIIAQSVLIQANSIVSRHQIIQLALLRKLQVDQHFVNIQSRLTAFIEGKIDTVHSFITARQGVVLSAIFGAIASIQGAALNALQRGDELGDRFSELIQGVINRAGTSVQNRVGGIVNQIINLINTVPLPNIPGVEQVRNMAQNIVSQVAGVVQSTLGEVLRFIQSTVSTGMNLLRSFLLTLRSAVNRVLTLVSAAIMRILNMISSLLNRILNRITLILRGILYNTIIPMINYLRSGVQQTINRFEQDALQQIQDNTEQHLEALATAAAPGGGDAGAGTPVTVGEFIAGVSQISTSSRLNNVRIVQEFNARLSGFMELFIPTLLAAASQIILEITSRIAQVLVMLISIVSSIIQRIRSFIEIALSFIQSIIQLFTSTLNTLVQFITSMVQNPVERIIRFASRTISRIRNSISRLIRNLVTGSGLNFNLNSILGNFSLSQSTNLITPAFAGPPIQIIGGFVIIMIAGFTFAISALTLAVIIAVAVVIIALLLYLLYRWLTRPRLPAPPEPPPKPTGREYHPGANFNISYSVPLEKNDIQASKGEKLIFGVTATDEDKYRQIGTPAWTTTPGTGPYEVLYKVAGDADLITAGSGTKTHSDLTLSSRNIYLFIKNTWNGSKITVSATVKDKALPVVSPDVGTTKDTVHKITWTIVNRTSACPTGLSRVHGPGSTWTAAPAVYTYLATPEINPPGRPNYEKQTVLESFPGTDSNGAFTMNDLKTDWKTTHPTLNTPDKVAVFLFGVSNNGTFVFNNQDQMSDQHSGFGTTSPFKASALSRAAGIGYKIDQTYSCAGNSIGTATVERRYSTITGVEVKKTGP